MILAIAFGLLRHLLTFAGGALAAHGYLTQGESSTAVGALMTLAGLAWSAWQKRPVSAPTPIAPPNPLPAARSDSDTTADDLNREEALLLRQEARK